MRALIIGCGYVGLPLAAELVCRGHVVYGLRRSRGLEDELTSAGIKPLYADVTRPETLAGLPRDFEWAVNCVSSRGGGADEYRRVYLEGTRHLIEWLAPAQPGKFVYTGSTSVYGQTDGSWVHEGSAVEPTARTAQALLETERLLAAAAEQRGFPAVVLRVAGIYGPGRHRALDQFTRNAARLEGNGERILNMVHRDDVVGAILMALERGPKGQVFNVADDEPVSQLDFFTWLAGALGRSPPPFAEAPERARGETNKRVSNRKLKTELNCKFKYPNYRTGYAAEINRMREKY